MDTALLVLDIQKDEAGGTSRMTVAGRQIEQMQDKVNFLIGQARNMEIPVVYVRDEMKPNDWFLNPIGKYKVGNVHRVDGSFFPGNNSDAFSNPKLESVLNEMGVRSLAITGMFAEGGVTATALGSIRRNFPATVVADAVAGKSDTRRDWSLKRLRDCGITVTDSSRMIWMNK